MISLIPPLINITQWSKITSLLCSSCLGFLHIKGRDYGMNTKNDNPKVQEDLSKPLSTNQIIL